MAVIINKIPVVDFAAYNNISGKCNEILNPEINKLAQEIYDAFTTVGFVYIKNHGIPESEVIGTKYLLCALRNIYLVIFLAVYIILFHDH